MSIALKTIQDMISKELNYAYIPKILQQAIHADSQS